MNAFKSSFSLHAFLLLASVFCCTIFAEVTIFDSIEKLADVASEHMIQCIRINNRNNKRTIFGLATGSTPLAMYEAFIKKADERNLDLSKVTTFNLDEYVGLAKDHPQSYHFYMWKNFFEKLVSPKRPNGIKPENIHIPNGYAKTESDLSQQELTDLQQLFPNRSSGQSLSEKEELSVLLSRIAAYEKLIKELGPIDLQILGVGINGHVGFAEPGSAINGETMLVELTGSTRLANARFFDNKIDAVPRYALTMGIGTIMRAKEILLLATGKTKAEAMKYALAGKIDEEIPVTALQKHPNVSYFLDKDAASLLNKS